MGRFPCNLVEPEQVAALIGRPEPRVVDDGEDTIEPCRWRAALNEGDVLGLTWSPPVYDVAKRTGRVIKGLGDEAFYDQINVHDGVQTRLFVRFDEQQFAVTVVTLEPDLPGIVELARSIVDRCGARSCPPDDDTTATAAFGDSTCALLTLDEVVANVGPLAEGVATGSEQPSCTWGGGGGSADLVLVDRTDDYFDRFSALPGAQAVPELGDQASYRVQQLMVRVEGRTFHLLGPVDGTPEQNIAVLSALARLVIARI